MKAIDSITVSQKGYNFVFVRVGNHIGWFCAIGGNQYGDYISSGDKIKDAEEVEELCSVLAHQAAATIKELIGVNIDGTELFDEVKKRLS